MSRRNLTYVCQNCGAASARWQGKCEACGEWNSMVEEGDGTGIAGKLPGRAPRKGRKFALEALTGESNDAPRMPSGMSELDRVTLIGGDLTIDEVGRRAGTIGYEILTNLGSRYARHYREAKS
jgi:predicted ATP-dependent serine protease